MVYILKGTNEAGRVVYYTGKAGETQFSDQAKRSHIYGRDDGAAVFKRDNLNAVRKSHGYTFEIVPL